MDLSWSEVAVETRVLMDSNNFTNILFAFRIVRLCICRHSFRVFQVRHCGVEIQKSTLLDWQLRAGIFIQKGAAIIRGRLALGDNPLRSDRLRRMR